MQRAGRAWIVYPSALSLGMLVGLLLSGLPRSAAGFALGLFGTAFCAVMLKMGIGMIAQTAERQGKASFAPGCLFFLFMLKLPVYVVCAMVAQKMGGYAVPWFIFGLGMVYLSLIGWAQAQR